MSDQGVDAPAAIDHRVGNGVEHREDQLRVEHDATISVRGGRRQRIRAALRVRRATAPPPRPRHEPTSPVPRLPELLTAPRRPWRRRPRVRRRSRARAHPAAPHAMAHATASASVPRHDLLVQLRELACDRDPPIGAERFGQVGQRARQAVWRLVERRSCACLGCQQRQPLRCDRCPSEAGSPRTRTGPWAGRWPPARRWPRTVRARPRPRTPARSPRAPAAHPDRRCPAFPHR